MSRRKKKLPLLGKVEITGIGARGKAIARVDNFVTFVSGGLPGDVVDLQVTRQRKTYQEARVVKFHSRSPGRTDPFCFHFGICGGCRWQDLQYSRQLHFKHKEVVDTLERVGGLELPAVRPILASANEREYRNKLEFTFSNRRWLSAEEIGSGDEFVERKGLGFHVPGMFDRVIDLRECHLQPEPSNSIRQAVRDYTGDAGLDFYDIRQGKGFLRNLVIRTSRSGEVMVIVVFGKEDKESANAMLGRLRADFPDITSLMYCVNRKANDSLSDQEILLHSGRDHIIEHMEDLRFRIGPKSFFQTNTLQALELYRCVREFAGLEDKETVYDLYTGTGTIGLFLARKARKVVGIEYLEEAVRDAEINASLNGIGNARFFSGDIRQVMDPAFMNREGNPDVLVTDPPRAGMHKEVVRAILHAAPSRIVYVSCNPATQARDLKMLAGNYRIREVQPVDMFPHTYHVENVVLLERR